MEVLVVVVAPAILGPQLHIRIIPIQMVIAKLELILITIQIPEVLMDLTGRMGTLEMLILTAEWTVKEDLSST
jgi:hypothetical protein